MLLVQIRPIVYASCIVSLLFLCCASRTNEGALSAQTTTQQTFTPKSTRNLHFTLLQTYNHDNQYFTQGLYYDKESDCFVESTGRLGLSGIFVYKRGETKALQEKHLAKTFFGEGLTVYKNKIYQLTWQNHVCFVYDRQNLQLLKQYNLPTEGWGITHNDTSLIVSDGSNQLFFYHPYSFALQKTIFVRENGISVQRLNELEYIDGYIFANVWMTSRIVMIDPVSGEVVASLDLSAQIAALHLDELQNTDAVLNGIAYNPQQKKIYLTGKLWPVIFEIQLVP